MACSKWKKSSFNIQWLNDDALREWLAPCPSDIFSFYCKLCKKTVNLSNMGKQAVTSHMKSKKHQISDKSKAVSYGIGVFFKVKDQNNTCINTNNQFQTSTIELSQPSTSLINQPQEARVEPEDNSIKKTQGLSKRGLEVFLAKESITKAEILWCLMSVEAHLSMNAAGKCVEMFPILFPDSDIAKGMEMGRTKMAYVIVYGLGPYFLQAVLKEMDPNDFFAVTFDESLNKISQKQQMDVIVRYWSKQRNEVSSRYISSAFLGHTKSEDLLEAFKNQLSSLDLKKMIHVSTDGPNVNIKFLRLLKDLLKEDENDPILVEFGTCGLHNLHNAFKTAIKSTGWQVVEFLRATYNVFKNVPARRADYITVSGSKRFPQKFCAVRWLNNVDVVERAQECLSSLKKYVDFVSEEKKEPTSESYRLMKKCLQDELIGPKLAFYKTLALEVEPFLRQFQADKPLAPFLYTDLRNILSSFMGRFVKSEILAAQELTKIDLEKSENLISCKKINLGYETRVAIRQTKAANDLQILVFRKECMTALKALCIQILKKSPLTMKLTKHLTFCDPSLIAKDLNLATTRLSHCLETFITHKWVNGFEAEKIDKEFKAVCEMPIVVQAMTEYSRKTRLDHHWVEVLSTSDANHSSHLLKFLKKIFILSHGNAAVERGFSVNKECLVDNLSHESLIAQRLVWEGIQAQGGTKNVTVSKEMIHYARNARSRYQEALENKRKTNLEGENAKRNKKRAAEKMKELAEKKKKIMDEASSQMQVLEEEMRALSK